MTDIFEGSIIRSARRLDEFLNQVNWSNFGYLILLYCELWQYKYEVLVAKGLVAELEPSHALGVWGFKGKRVWVAGLAAYCNYLLKKKEEVVVALILFSYDLQFSVELGSCINQYDVIWFSVLSLVFHPIKKKKNFLSKRV